jgi:carbon storage regulator
LLVLTRRLNEAIRIGSDIEIRVVELSDGYVRLGIAAPRAIPVHRDEVFREIQEANRAAAGTGPAAFALAERTLVLNRGSARNGKDTPPKLPGDR